MSRLARSQDRILDAFSQHKFRVAVQLAVLWYILIYPLYNVVGHLSFRLQDELLVPLTFLDDLVTFSPYFVYGYILMFLLPAITTLFSLHHSVSLPEIRAFYTAQILLLLGCYVFYLLVPSSAEIIQADLTLYPETLALKLVELMYTWGVPYNAFPSYHVAPIAFTALFMYHKMTRVFWWSLPLMLVPVLATVYIKYHFVADIFGGIVFGVIAYIFYATYLEPKYSRV